MADTVFCRIRLNFEDTEHDIRQSYWHLVEHKDNHKIYDIQKIISERFFANKNVPSLFLDGAMLPSWEKSLLLRDGDAVTVVTENSKETLRDEFRCCIQDSMSRTISEKRSVENSTHDNIQIEDEQDTKRERCSRKKEKKRKKDCSVDEKITSIPDREWNIDAFKEKSKNREINCDDVTNNGSPVVENLSEYKNVSFIEDNSRDNETESTKDEVTSSVSKKRKKDTPVVEPAVDVFLSEYEKTDGENDGKRLKRSMDDCIVSNTFPEVSLTANTTESSEKREKRRRHRKRKNKRHDTPFQSSINRTENKGNIGFEIKTKFSDSNKHLKFHSDSSEEVAMPTEQSNSVGCEKLSATVKISPSLQKVLFEGEKMGSRKKKKIDNENGIVSMTDYDDRDNISENSFVVCDFVDQESMSVENCPMTDTSDVAIHLAESPSILPSTKLPNGVTVFSRPRRKQNRVLWELSKDQQLNTVATNKSIILQNSQNIGDASQVRPDTEDYTDTTMVQMLPLFKDYTRFPSLHGPPRIGDKIAYKNSQDIGDASQVRCDTEDYTNTTMVEVLPLFIDYTRFPLLHGPPRIGDKIAYKVLEVSENYTPEVSGFKEAVVTKFDPVTENVELTNLHIGPDASGRGKFEVTVSDDEEVLTNLSGMKEKVTLSFMSLLEPRLVT